MNKEINECYEKFAQETKALNESEDTIYLFMLMNRIREIEIAELYGNQSKSISLKIELIIEFAEGLSSSDNHHKLMMNYYGVNLITKMISLELQFKG
jgi:hypothetical protein